MLVKRNTTKKIQRKLVTILLIPLVPILVGMIGITMDYHTLTAQKEKMQSAVDLSSHSAIQTVTSGNKAVRQTAISKALNHSIHETEISLNYPYHGNPNKIEVIASRNVQLPFRQSTETITVSSISEKNEE